MKTAFTMLSPPGARARLSILIFHRVLPAQDPIFPGEVDAPRFDEICSWLKGWAEVLPLDEAAARLASGSLPARACAITFDDGYEDNRSVALPILQKHGLSATFFIATGFLGNGRMWNDRVIEAIRRAPDGLLDCRELLAQDGAGFALAGPDSRREAIEAILAAIKYRPIDERLALACELERRIGVPESLRLMMDDSQVRELRQAGMQIGAHTCSHPILATLDRSQARREIGDGKRYLEELLREPVSLFAYPNGKPGRDYSPESVEIVKELGFETAVSTAWGAASGRSDRHQLPRFSPWDRTRLRWRARLLGNLRQG